MSHQQVTHTGIQCALHTRTHTRTHTHTHTHVACLHCLKIGLNSFKLIVESERSVITVAGVPPPLGEDVIIVA